MAMARAARLVLYPHPATFRDMSAPWPEELPKGFEFDRYTVLDCVWRGSAASLYRAETAAQGVVALKVFDRTKSDPLPDRRRLSKRARIGAGVRHPNLAVILEVGAWRERSYVASEWLEGCDLEGYLDRWGVMSEHEVAELGLHLIAGLMALHHAGALHGDIKPSSVFLCDGVDGDVIPKLLLSELPRQSALASPVDSTTRQLAVSTPAYLAPEGIRGRGVGPYSDQYSVCAVLYECAVGHPPFEGDSLLALLRAMAVGTILPPRSVRPELSEALEAALLRGLSSEPRERFGSLRDLGRALWPLVSEHAKQPWARSFGGGSEGAVRASLALAPPLASAGATPPPSRHRRALRKPALLLLVASIALSVGVGAFYFFAIRRGAGTHLPVEPGSKATSGLKLQY